MSYEIKATSYEIQKHIHKLWKEYHKLNEEFFKTKEDVAKMMSLRNQIEINEIMKQRAKHEEKQTFYTE